MWHSIGAGSAQFRVNTRCFTEAYTELCPGNMNDLVYLLIMATDLPAPDVVVEVFSSFPLQVSGQMFPRCRSFAGSVRSSGQVHTSLQISTSFSPGLLNTYF